MGGREINPFQSYLLGSVCITPRFHDLNSLPIPIWINNATEYTILFFDQFSLLKNFPFSLSIRSESKSNLNQRIFVYFSKIDVPKQQRRHINNFVNFVQLLSFFPWLFVHLNLFCHFILMYVSRRDDLSLKIQMSIEIWYLLFNIVEWTVH